MDNYGDESKLRRLAEACAGQFGMIMASFSSEQAKTLAFPELTKAWDAYYFGCFSEFDSALKNYISNGGPHFQTLFPVSISHHNFHRLMEVLASELGTQSLAATRIPERVADFLEGIRGLGLLFGKLQSLPRLN